MGNKPTRKHIDDCYDCVFFRERCDGRKMFVEKVSTKGVVRCRNQKANMTEAEIDAALKADGNTDENREKFFEMLCLNCIMKRKAR